MVLSRLVGRVRDTDQQESSLILSLPPQESIPKVKTRLLIVVRPKVSKVAVEKPIPCA